MLDTKLTASQSAEILKRERAAKSTNDDSELRLRCALMAIDAHKAHSLGNEDNVISLARLLHFFLSGND